MPTLTGKHLIGDQKIASQTATFAAIDPKTDQPLPTVFYEATKQEVDQAVKLAEQAFLTYRQKSSTEIAYFLEQIAEEILALGSDLIKRAMAETALPQGRLEGERGRTINQLRLFASLVREGSWVDASIDTAQPDRQPAPKVDIRRMLRPLGPVGIFGASNFPLAFSVAGGDTTSALAAGCPVVIKGHPAHPGTAEMVAGAIIKAAEKTGMPEGVCALIQGRTNEVGGYLVQHPLIQAVGFTGSYQGGKALFDLANQRAVPIPVYAEMGSTNPVFILPEAMAQNAHSIAEGLANSVTLGVGQFCTNPGIVFLPNVSETAQFQAALATKIKDSEVGTMLTNGIAASFNRGVDHFSKAKEIQLVANGQATPTSNGVKAAIFITDFEQFKKDAKLSEEVFGPSSLLVQTANRAELLEAANQLSGHLTATIHGTPEELLEYQPLIDILERKVGRLLINGFPTGVEVCHSMVHGGPFPATTAHRTTSVGTEAIKRFTRSVCYQNFPAALLPDALRDSNPLGIWRLVDGEFIK
ncbi:MAG: aldehyde dehydrogenase (NADP(+)) [Bacteroidota bacterium]